MPPPSSPALPLNVNGSATPSKPSTVATSAAAASATVKTSSSSEISSPHELTVFVESLLEQLDSKFTDMSSQILERMMQMSTRVDALEAAIQDIINGDAATGPPSIPQSPAIAQRRSGGV